MSTEAGRPRDPHVPLPPAAPPKPTTPPRPRTAPEPSAAPRGAAPIPQDEPTTRVAPRLRRAEDPESGPTPQRSGTAEREPGTDRPGTSATTARTGAVPPPPRQRPAAPPPPAHPPHPGPPPSDDVSGPPTFRLRPIRVDEPRRLPLRTVSAAVCLVLGVGLLGGTTAGTLLTGDAEAGASAAQEAFSDARALWHSVPVDELFPRTVRGEGAGPGGADRTWIRVAVAPDGTCRHAFDPLLAKAMAPVGCRRLIRATYADETSTSVITVGAVFTESGRKGMRELRRRFEEEDLGERTDLMPRTYAPRGTVAADFGDAQRASWTVRVRTDAPVVVYAVSGFADGRTVSEPKPAAEAVDPEATTAPAQAGLGHDALGLAKRMEKRLLAHLPEPGEEEAG